jgi:hypothetical protein
LGEENVTGGQDVMNMESVGALVFALWLKTSGLFGTILLHTFFVMFHLLLKFILPLFIHI